MGLLETIFWSFDMVFDIGGIDIDLNDCDLCGANDSIVLCIEVQINFDMSVEVTSLISNFDIVYDVTLMSK
jgi:hypothetical protein